MPIYLGSCCNHFVFTFAFSNSEPFPTTKNVPIDRLLAMISRLLALNSKSLSKTSRANFGIFHLREKSIVQYTWIHFSIEQNNWPWRLSSLTFSLPCWMCWSRWWPSAGLSYWQERQRLWTFSFKCFNGLSLQLIDVELELKDPTGKDHFRWIKWKQKINRYGQVLSTCVL